MGLEVFEVLAQMTHGSKLREHSLYMFLCSGSTQYQPSGTNLAEMNRLTKRLQSGRAGGAQISALLIAQSLYLFSFMKWGIDKTEEQK